MHLLLQFVVAIEVEILEILWDTPTFWTISTLYITIYIKRSSFCPSVRSFWNACQKATISGPVGPKMLVYAFFFKTFDHHNYKFNSNNGWILFWLSLLFFPAMSTYKRKGKYWNSKQLSLWITSTNSWNLITLEKYCS